MANPAQYENYRAEFLTLRYEEEPTQLIEELVGLAGDAAGNRPARQPWPGGSAAPYEPPQ